MDFLLSPCVGKFDMYVEDCAAYVRYCFADPMDAAIFRSRFEPKSDPFRAFPEKAGPAAAVKTTVEIGKKNILQQRLRIERQRASVARHERDGHIRHLPTTALPRFCILSPARLRWRSRGLSQKSFFSDRHSDLTANQSGACRNAVRF
jgi:hypothetical protein